MHWSFKNVQLPAFKMSDLFKFCKVSDEDCRKQVTMNHEHSFVLLLQMFFSSLLLQTVVSDIPNYSSNYTVFKAT